MVTAPQVALLFWLIVMFSLVDRFQENYKRPTMTLSACVVAIVFHLPVILGMMLDTSIYVCQMLNRMYDIHLGMFA